MNWSSVSNLPVKSPLPWEDKYLHKSTFIYSASVPQLVRIPRLVRRNTEILVGACSYKLPSVFTKGAQTQPIFPSQSPLGCRGQGVRFKLMWNVNSGDVGWASFISPTFCIECWADKASPTYGNLPPFEIRGQCFHISSNRTRGQAAARRQRVVQRS